MSSKAGETVTVEVRSARRDPLRFAWSEDAPLRFRELVNDGRALELWDRAPVDAAPAGFKDPYWARNEHGAWYIVAWPRAGKGHEPCAYPVDDEVRMRLAMLKASPDVAGAVIASLLRMSKNPELRSSHPQHITHVAPVRALLHSRIA